MSETRTARQRRRARGREKWMHAEAVRTGQALAAGPTEPLGYWTALEMYWKRLHAVVALLTWGLS